MVQVVSNANFAQGLSKAISVQGVSKVVLVQGLSKAVLVQGVSKGVLVQGVSKGVLVQGVSKDVLVVGVSKADKAILAWYKVFLKQSLKNVSLKYRKVLNSGRGYYSFFTFYVRLQFKGAFYIRAPTYFS